MAASVKAAKVIRRLSRSRSANDITPFHKQQQQEQQQEHRHPLVASIDELAAIVGGTGRAKLVWNNLRSGLDPTRQNSESPATAERLRALEIPILPGEAKEITKSGDGTIKFLLNFEEESS